MKAYRVHEYGEAAQFIEDEVDKPESKQGHVVIEVKASSLNPIDHKLLRKVLTHRKKKLMLVEKYLTRT